MVRRSAGGMDGLDTESIEISFILYPVRGLFMQ